MAAVSFRLRSWAGTQWRTLAAVAVVIALAGGLALTLVAGAARTLTAPDRYARAWGGAADIGIEQSAGRPRIRELQQLPSVASVEMATFLFGALVTPDGAMANGLLFAGTPGAVNERVIDGRVARADRPGEFTATQDFVDALGLHLGSRLRLVTITQATAGAQGFDVTDPDGPALTATLVGILGGPGQLEGDAYPIALFPRSLLEQGDIGVAASEAVVDLVPGATASQLRDELDGLPGASAFSVQPAEVVAQYVRDAVRVQGQGLAVLAAIVGLAAITVLAQLSSRQFRLDPAEREALRAIGCTRRHLVLEPAVRTAVVGVAGAVGATAIAIAASSAFPLGFARHLDPHPGLRLDPVVHLLGGLALAAVLVLLAVAWSLADHLRARATSPRRLVERVLPPLPRPQATTALRFAFGPGSGAAGASRAPIAGLALVLAVLFGALTFGANLRHLLEDPPSYGVDFDIGIGAGGDEVPAEVRQGIEADPDVDGITLYGSTALQLGPDSLAIVGMHPLEGDVVPEVLRGRLPSGPDELALGPVAARRFGLDLGDRLEGSGAGGALDFHVTGIALIPGIEGADLLGDVALVTDAGFHRIDPAATMGAAAVSLAPGARTAAAVQIARLAGLDEADAATPRFDRPAAISNLDRIRSIPWIVAVAVGALGILSLGHLMLVAVRRRRRDLAVLRAMGASRTWLTEVVHWQATLTAAVLVGVSAPLGALAGSGLYRRFADRLGARPAALLPIGALAIGLCTLLVFANAAAAVAARSVRRASLVRALDAGG